MELADDEALQTLKSRLREDQLAFMREADVSYGEADVARCGEVLAKHVAALQQAADASEGLDCVRATVIELNRLNERCDGDLLETDAREMICAFIMRAGALRGFHAEDEDVTEEWREW